MGDDDGVALVARRLVMDLATWAQLCDLADMTDREPLDLAAEMLDRGVPLVLAAVERHREQQEKRASRPS